MKHRTITATLVLCIAGVGGFFAWRIATQGGAKEKPVPTLDSAQFDKATLLSNGWVISSGLAMQVNCPVQLNKDSKSVPVTVTLMNVSAIPLRVHLPWIAETRFIIEDAEGEPLPPQIAFLPTPAQAPIPGPKLLQPGEKVAASRVLLTGMRDDWHGMQPPDGEWISWDNQYVIKPLGGWRITVEYRARVNETDSSPSGVDWHGTLRSVPILIEN